MDLPVPQTAALSQTRSYIVLAFLPFRTLVSLSAKLSMGFPSTLKLAEASALLSKSRLVALNRLEERLYVHLPQETASCSPEHFSRQPSVPVLHLGSADSLSSMGPSRSRSALTPGTAAPPGRKETVNLLERPFRQ
jgi:hypothetical protein